MTFSTESVLLYRELSVPEAHLLIAPKLADHLRLVEQRRRFIEKRLRAIETVCVDALDSDGGMIPSELHQQA